MIGFERDELLDVGVRTVHLNQPKIFTDYVAFVGGDADVVTLRRIVTSELPGVTLPA